MGKSGYTKCMELVKSMIKDGKTKLTSDKIKEEIAKNIGFSVQHDTIGRYFTALKLFGFIEKFKDDENTYIIIDKSEDEEDDNTDSQQ